MILSHRIHLQPTKAQAQAFAKACGTARFTWNWALVELKAALNRKEKPKIPDLKRQWNREKPDWVYESPKGANQSPFRHLSRALSAFFKKTARFPRFKKKGASKDSFEVENDKFQVKDKKVRLPKIGWVRMSEHLRFEGKILSGTVSRDADRWFLSVTVDVGNFRKEKIDDKIVGVDLGVKTLATLSTGEKVVNPRHLGKRMKLLRRRSRQHSRKDKGSKNRRKSAIRLARLHRKIRNARKDTLHKLTTKICRESQAVVIEDLNVKGMMANRRLARAIQDVGFYEFRRQVEYKSKIWGTEVIMADRFFPSSKTCSACGWKKDDLTLSDREFECTDCGAVFDRDLNAALNLRKLACCESDATGGFPGSNACGEEGSGLGFVPRTKPASVKQELGRRGLASKSF